MVEVVAAGTRIEPVTQAAQLFVAEVQVTLIELATAVHVVLAIYTLPKLSALAITSAST